jgi:hypothetical protein
MTDEFKAFLSYDVRVEDHQGGSPQPKLADS